MNKKSLNKDFFKKQNPEMLYVLGFFAADGSLTINKRGGHYFSLQSKDKQIIDDIKKIMLSDHKVSERFDRRTGNSFYRIQIGSKQMCEDLMRIGFKRNKTSNLPVLNIDRDLYAYFVRGYFDGDGNIWSGTIHKERKTSHKNVLLAFTSASCEFLEKLKFDLEVIVGTTGSLFKGKKNYYRLQYSKKDALKIYEFMYNTDTSICLQRKKRSFDKILKNMQP